jgi:hypothetical protein
LHTFIFVTHLEQIEVQKGTETSSPAADGCRENKQPPLMTRRRRRAKRVHFVFDGEIGGAAVAMLEANQMGRRKWAGHDQQRMRRRIHPFVWPRTGPNRSSRRQIGRDEPGKSRNRSRRKMMKKMRWRPFQLRTFEEAEGAEVR